MEVKDRGEEEVVCCGTGKPEGQPRRKLDTSRAEREFGTLSLDDSGKLKKFIEKPAGDGSWINGGFFVLEPEIFDYIEGDNTFWEREPLENLSKDGQLVAYKHSDFWKCMDTLRDKRELEEMWKSGNPPWKVWK